MHRIVKQLNLCIHLFNKNIYYCLLWNMHAATKGTKHFTFGDIDFKLFIKENKTQNFWPDPFS